MKITKDQKDNLAHHVQKEGLEETFINYSGFEEIESKKFHKERRSFVEAYTKFNNYLEREGIHSHISYE